MRKALEILKPIDGIGQLYLSSEDVVRHRLVKEIIKSYDLAEEEEQAEKVRIREQKEAELAKAKLEEMQEKPSIN